MSDILKKLSVLLGTIIIYSMVLRTGTTNTFYEITALLNARWR